MLDRKSAKQSQPDSKINRASSLPPSSFPTALVARFAIVGVGASAGGLDAFKQLLRHLSIDTGMAFVPIQHLAPTHKSLLTEILARTTAMPVCEVTDGIEIVTDRVYIIPPNTTMKLVGRVLHLSPRERTRSGYLPVDRFFESLAAECGQQGIGVVLSGGLRAELRTAIHQAKQLNSLPEGLRDRTNERIQFAKFPTQQCHHRCRRAIGQSPHCA